MNTEKYLPIGTVVLLKGGTKRVMIVGFCSMDLETNSKMADYTGCFYPEGIFTLDRILAFNHKDIDKIFHLGLSDAEHVQFRTRLKDLMKGVADDDGNLLISPEQLSAMNSNNN